MVFNLETPVEDSQVLEAYARLRSPFKAAVQLGIDPEAVLEVLSRHPDARQQKKAGPMPMFAEKHGGTGRPEMLQYLVARKTPAEPWPNRDFDIAQARRKFEEGTHDLATGRDGNWLLLYCIPRRWKQPRPGYFNAA